MKDESMRLSSSEKGQRFQGYNLYNLYKNK